MKSIVDNEKLTALADAIRTKTGSSDSLTIDQMTSAIENISVGGGEDRLKKFIETTKSTSNLFRDKGTLDLKGLIQPNDTINVENAGYMFFGSSIINLPLLNFPNLKYAQYMFGNATYKKTDAEGNIIEDTIVNNILSNIDFSKLMNTNAMFRECNMTNLELTDGNFSSVNDAGYMFYNSTFGTLNIPEVINMPLATEASNLFNSCRGSVPNNTLTINFEAEVNASNLFRTSHIENLDKLIINCKTYRNIDYFLEGVSNNDEKQPLIKEIEINVSNDSTFFNKRLPNYIAAYNNYIEKVTINFNAPNNYEFNTVYSELCNCYNCSNLTDYYLISTSKSHKTYQTMSLFGNCPNITNVYIKFYICSSLKISDGTTYGNLITLDSLLCIIRYLYDRNTSAYVFTIGSVNIEKLSNVYVKLVDSGEGFLPFEVCESTDEGAMTVAQYMSLKNWSLA